MVKSVKEQLSQNLECKHVLDCLYDLKDIDKKCYQHLNEEEKEMSTDELSDIFERDQSTIHRSLERQRDAGLVERRKRTYDKGGYKYMYRARNVSEVVSEMQNLLETWYSEIDDLVDEFERDFG